jgi:hypothetical protein
MFKNMEGAIQLSKMTADHSVSNVDWSRATNKYLTYVWRIYLHGCGVEIPKQHVCGINVGFLMGKRGYGFEFSKCLRVVGWVHQASNVKTVLAVSSVLYCALMNFTIVLVWEDDKMLLLGLHEVERNFASVFILFHFLVSGYFSIALSAEHATTHALWEERLKNFFTVRVEEVCDSCTDTYIAVPYQAWNRRWTDDFEWVTLKAKFVGTGSKITRINWLNIELQRKAMNGVLIACSLS